MNIFYTSSYGNKGVPVKIHQRISAAAKSLGFRELPIYISNSEDNDIEQVDLDVQMDGSFSAFTNDAVLIMQYPSGGGFRHDKAIMDHARLYHGAVVVIYNHNSNSENEELLTSDEKALFESADLVVDAYRLDGFDEELFTKKELIDALLAATYAE